MHRDESSGQSETSPRTNPDCTQFFNLVFDLLTEVLLYLIQILSSREPPLSTSKVTDRDLLPPLDRFVFGLVPAAESVVRPLEREDIRIVVYVVREIPPRNHCS